MQPKFHSVPVLDLLLYRENPRHVSKNTQEEVIQYLLASEEVHNLARHMSKHGINPLEVVAVFRDDDGNLVVAEGNRRVCAAQLLTDPQKAPEASRSRFKALAQKSQDVTRINIAEFKDYQTAQPWLQVLHDGEQDGIGRRRWKPEQKYRATTNKSKDALAVEILDYAESEGIISNDDRSSLQLSTATRYLANPGVRSAMGIESNATSDKIQISVDKSLFDRILTRFLEDLKNKRLHSRSATAEWQSYASELARAFGTNSTPGTPTEGKSKVANEPPMVLEFSRAVDTSARSTPTDEGSPRKSGPGNRQRARARLVTPETRYIARSDDVVRGLNSLESFKLSSLYNSLTSIRLDEHPALLTTGAWVFVETLTALHGRNATSDFVSYLNGKFASLGMGKDQGKDCKLSLEYISQHGNAQKHSASFTAVDARNLNNHFAVLEVVFSALLSNCLATKRATL